MNKMIEIPEGTDFNNDFDKAFPVDVFPQTIQSVINDTNANLTYPIDFIGASILYAASVSIGTTLKVQVMKGWDETATIYLAIVGRAGTNKTHPQYYGLKPILDRDQISFTEYKKAKQVYDEHSGMSIKERAEAGVPEPIKPIFKKFIVSDATPEALAEVHQHNLRGIGSYNDELAGWFKNFNRYHKGNDMEFWLSNWSGKPVIIDRKSGEPIMISNPFISVCGTIQDGILNDLSKDGRTQNGFIDRILFVYPENLQKEYWSENEITPGITEKYYQVINKLLSLNYQVDETGNPKSEVLNFTPDALHALKEWQRFNTDRCNEATEAQASIYSKLEIYVVRLSLIIQALKYASNEGDKVNIELDSVRGAIRLIDYFRHTAFKVLTFISGTPIDRLPTEKQDLYKNLPETFTTAEGMEIAQGMGIHERNYKRFISESIFKHVKHGVYEKRF